LLSRILLLSLCACTLLCADQVVLKNGDIITGSVIKKDGAKLTIKSEFLGEVSIPWTAIKSLKSDQELVVVLPGGESVKGKVSTSGDNLDVAAANGEKSAPLSGVTAVRDDAEQHAWERLQHPGILELWTGAYNMGLALARGNAKTDTLTTAFDANRVSRHDKITAHFDEIYSTARIGGLSSTTASAEHANWTYQRDLGPRFFVSTLNAYDHDAFQDLDLRFVAGGGVGVNAIKTPRTSLGLLAGGDYEREAFFANVTRTSGEFNAGDDFQYKISSASSITQDFRIFPNVTSTGQYRFSFDLSAVTALKKWMAWHVTIGDQFLSNPLFGRQRNDLILSTGFRVSFAR